MCRQLHPLGSSRAVFLLDEEGRYAGTVLLADLFSIDFDVGADTREIFELAKYRETTLTPSMNIKVAMACFDKSQSEILARRSFNNTFILREIIAAGDWIVRKNQSISR